MGITPPPLFLHKIKPIVLVPIDLLKFLLYYQNHNTKFPLILNFSLSTRKHL
nr:MAG TPA: hypothetical protein [Caudoviricetes sp.]